MEKEEMRAILTIAAVILCMATTVHAQDINKDTLTKRLVELEKTKVQIEQAYTELIARISELKYLLEDKKDESGTTSRDDKVLVK